MRLPKPLLLGNKKGLFKETSAILIVLGLLTVAGFISWNGGVDDDSVPDGHYPLYEDIIAIKDKLLINITDVAFPETGVRECVFYELREEDADEYFQTTVNFWVFQYGQGLHGDIEAFVEIYNKPDNYTAFVVEVARNTWWELTVSYDGVEMVHWDAVLADGNHTGYATFEVIP